jgi:hypothetical protein
MIADPEKNREKREMPEPLRIRKPVEAPAR